MFYHNWCWHDHTWIWLWVEKLSEIISGKPKYPADITLQQFSITSNHMVPLTVAILSKWRTLTCVSHEQCSHFYLLLFCNPKLAIVYLQQAAVLIKLECGCWIGFKLLSLYFYLKIIKYLHISPSCPLSSSCLSLPSSVSLTEVLSEAT